MTEQEREAVRWLISIRPQPFALAFDQMLNDCSHYADTRKLASDLDKWERRDQLLDELSARMEASR